MIEKILNIFTEMFPERNPINIRQIDDGRYFIVAPQKGVDVDYGDPYFIVDNAISTVGYYRLSNMTEFFNIMNLSPIWEAQAGQYV